MHTLLKLPIEKVSEGVLVEEIIFEIDEMKLAPFNSSFFTVKPNASSMPDKHKVKEAWIIVSGYGTLICNDEIKYISTGDVIYFESFDTHMVKNTDNVELKIISIWW